MAKTGGRTKKSRPKVRFSVVVSEEEMGVIAKAVEDGSHKSLAAFVRKAIQKQISDETREKSVNFWAMFDDEGNIREGGIVAHNEDAAVWRFYEGIDRPLGLLSRLDSDRKWIRLQEQARRENKTLLEYYVEHFPAELGDSFEGLSPEEKIAKAKGLVAQTLGVANQG